MLVRFLFAAVLVCSLPTLSNAATLRFSSDRSFPPETVDEYLEMAYCGHPRLNIAPRNRECAAVHRWMASNVGKPRAFWSLPPVLD